MAFNSFDRAGHRMLSAEITQELQALAQRHGLTISAGGGAIGSDELVIKVTAKTNDTQAIEAKARQEIGWYGRQFNLVPDDYGATFYYNSKRWKFVGVSPNRPKYPLDAIELRSGRTFKLPANAAPKVIEARPQAGPTTPTTPIIATQASPLPTMADVVDAHRSGHDLDAFSQF